MDDDTDGDAGWWERCDVVHRAVHGEFLTSWSPTPAGLEEPAAVWCTRRLADEIFWRAAACMRRPTPWSGRPSGFLSGA